MRERLAALEVEGASAIAAATSLDDLEAIRLRYFGRKGLLNGVLRGVGGLPETERPVVGQLANRVKATLLARLDERADALRTVALEHVLATDRIDVTMPGRRQPLGHVHPLRVVEDDVVGIFVAMGFDVAEGPEVEDDFHNFGALNIPEDHPARDMHDTFYLAGDDRLLLRTHTSPVQIRVMHHAQPPLRVVVPGTVYRRDDPDATHSPMFQQIEGLMVGEDVSFAHLKGVLTEFLQRLFGHATAVRFRPSFFPFTEPSAEVDVACFRCGPTGEVARGCRICRGSRWLEILGCGMVHPNVFRAVGYDPAVVRGFAFGLGIDRIALLRHELDDLRLFYENDLRFLEQF